jgi:Xaa-Pro aminopeptidase
MFSKEIYMQRRKLLKERFQSGVLLFPGNSESPMNYPANAFPFRQDSTFLYYWGLDFPGLVAVIDIDEDEEIIFGYDFTVDDIIWMGPQETVRERANRVGVDLSKPLEAMDERIGQAVKLGRKVLFLPQYRSDNTLLVERLAGIPHSQVNDSASEEFIKAVVSQRSVKSAEEIQQIETALDISYKMNETAMKMSRPGIYEKEVAGAVEGIVLSSGSYISFPVIFSIHGEILHGHSHENLMKEGDILVLDSGAESSLHYASDITRTFPVKGKFTNIQKEVYQIVLSAEERAIDLIKPGIPFLEIHHHVAHVIAEGMKQLGFMKGNTEDAVEAGAHALFFPHGLGHMMGLDVHDMENLGEDYVGYDDEITRSDQFGLAYLRLGRKLQPGFVITVEPGIYFMPELIDKWADQNKYNEYIQYDKIKQYKDFGGIRIEDDVLVTENGHQVLGKPIPKKVEEVEAMMSI